MDEKGRKVVLALGGGAALGWAHIGVIRALSAGGVPIDAIAGTSIGAIVGAAHLAGKLDVLEDLARRMDWRQLLNYTDLRFSGGGLLAGQSVMRELEAHLGSGLIEDLPKPFAAVSADLLTGRRVVFTQGRLLDAVRSSISIPGVFAPHQHNGMLLVDGGLVEPLPVVTARSLGADLVIGIDILSDFDGRARAAGIVPADDSSGSPPSGRSRRRRSLLPERGSRDTNSKAPRVNLRGVLVTSFALLIRQLTREQLKSAPADA